MKQKENARERRKKNNTKPDNELTSAPAVDFAHNSNTVSVDGMVGGADETRKGERHVGSDEDAVDMEDNNELAEEEGGRFISIIVRDRNQCKQ